MFFPKPHVIRKKFLNNIKDKINDLISNDETIKDNTGQIEAIYYKNTNKLIIKTKNNDNTEVILAVMELDTIHIIFDNELLEDVATIFNIKLKNPQKDKINDLISNDETIKDNTGQIEAIYYKNTNKLIIKTKNNDNTEVILAVMELDTIHIIFDNELLEDVATIFNIKLKNPQNVEELQNLVIDYKNLPEAYKALDCRVFREVRQSILEILHEEEVIDIPEIKEIDLSPTNQVIKVPSKTKNKKSVVINYYVKISSESQKVNVEKKLHDNYSEQNKEKEIDIIINVPQRKTILNKEDIKKNYMLLDQINEKCTEELSENKFKELINSNLEEEINELCAGTTQETTSTTQETTSTTQETTSTTQETTSTTQETTSTTQETQKFPIKYKHVFSEKNSLKNERDFLRVTYENSKELLKALKHVLESLLSSPGDKIVKINKTEIDIIKDGKNGKIDVLNKEDDISSNTLELILHKTEGNNFLLENFFPSYHLTPQQINICFNNLLNQSQVSGTLSSNEDNPSYPTTQQINNSIPFSHGIRNQGSEELSSNEENPSNGTSIKQKTYFVYPSTSPQPQSTSQTSNHTKSPAVNRNADLATVIVSVSIALIFVIIISETYKRYKRYKQNVICEENETGMALQSISVQPAVSVHSDQDSLLNNTNSR